jgi:hypothetical protein
MDEDQKHYFKVAIGCILGMIAVLAVLTYLNSSDIIKLSIQVD